MTRFFKSQWSNTPNGASGEFLQISSSGNLADDMRKKSLKKNVFRQSHHLQGVQITRLIWIFRWFTVSGQVDIVVGPESLCCFIPAVF